MSKLDIWLEPERLKQLKVWIDKGLPRTEIANKMGTTVGSFHYLIRTRPAIKELFAVKRISKKEEWSAPEKIEQISRWLREGFSQKQIADKIGITRGALCNWRKEVPAIADCLPNPMRKTHSTLRSYIETNDVWQDLANAIVLQAAEDYKKLLNYREKHPNAKRLPSPNSKVTLTELNSFFNGEWCELLCGIEGKAVKEKAKAGYENNKTRGKE